MRGCVGKKEEWLVSERCWGKKGEWLVSERVHR